MSNKVIVSIISKQSIPNMVLMKNHMDADYFINIVTDGMSDSNEYLIKALNPSQNQNITDKFKKIKIQNSLENNIDKIIENIGSLKEIYNDANEIYVNITGGTKILSIALYEYFYSNYKDKCKFLYLNIDSISTSYNVLNTQNKVDMEKNITLEEYLTSYGIEIINKDDTMPKYPANSANLLVNHAISKKGIFGENKIQDIKKALAKFALFLNEKYEKQAYNSGDIKLNIQEELSLYSNQDKTVQKYKNSIVEYIQDLHKTINTLPDINGMTYNSLKYISSGYFEEYLYYQLESILPYKNNMKDYLKTGIKIKINNPNRKHNQNMNNEQEFSDQELDILFMYNNAIYYIECKTYTTTPIITDSIFKQAAISNLLGLKKTNSFVTLNTYSEKQLENLKDKMKIYDINMITGNDIRQNKTIQKLKNLCKMRI